MIILFRVDASLQMGTGHVMSCLILAQALHDRGADCRFICREHPGHLLEQICQEGFEARVVDYGFLWGHYFDSAGFDDGNFWVLEKL
ncbi:hypothetical protein [Cylindrospermopsis raciborskii]|uniref:hypothetical protein n=1 Tax=Cylindrospermopsis raciborskii TaxID=77022 RepID=UPI0022BE3BCF|nr:hypothetical protein [Cylindrospermopsis raciborskii]MCZ2207715.1 hypothetical protein [Cylindrospermopsis raciborskii PAMP2011]